MIEKAMRAHEFRDDDAGYLAWLETHPDGYVINIARSHNTAQARVHHAGCRTISGQNPRGGPWTGPYVKVCAEHLAGLEAVGDRPRRGADPAVRDLPPCIDAPHDPFPPNQGSRCLRVATRSADRRRAVRSSRLGPMTYIRFERRPRLAKARCGPRSRLAASSSNRQLGRCCTPRFSATSVPTLTSRTSCSTTSTRLAVAGRNGIRFEHGAAVPLAPDGGEYPFCYRYALAPRSGGFADWQQGRTLASFDWTDLGAFARDKMPAQVWLALARGQVEVVKLSSRARCAVRRQSRRSGHRDGRSAARQADLVKGIFDGVICALQAHTDATVLPVVTERLAAVLPADPVEIRNHLLDQRRAVLGVVPRLVYPYREGVKWDPADHLCVAGELLAAEPVDSRWAIRGEIVELIAPVDRALSVR